MSDYQKIKVILPWKITLYHRKTDLSKNIYYDFTLNKKRYRGTTGSRDIETSEKFSIRRYLEIQDKGKDVKKYVKFEVVVSKFMKWKQPFVSEKTFSEYTRQIRFLIERFQGRDIESFTIKDYHEYNEWRREYYILHKRKENKPI